MATTGIVRFLTNDQVICNVLCACDGMPAKFGVALTRFLANIKLVRGVQGNLAHEANGVGCLAAQVIKYSKKRVGGIYLVPRGSTAIYYYTVYCWHGSIKLKIETDQELICDDFAAEINTDDLLEYDI